MQAEQEESRRKVSPRKFPNFDAGNQSYGNTMSCKLFSICVFCFCWFGLVYIDGIRKYAWVHNGRRIMSIPPAM